VFRPLLVVLWFEFEVSTWSRLHEQHKARGGKSGVATQRSRIYFELRTTSV